MIETEAWVLHAGGSGEPTPAELRLESFAFPEPEPWEVLVEPIYGSWEGNMTHALERDPVDICVARGEPRVVLGNAGVVRVLRPGPEAQGVREGDLCALSPVGRWNADGYLLKVVGYDAVGSVGLLARRLKLHWKQLIVLPRPTRFSYRQWAAFPVRYATAWSNWRVAYGCWRLQSAAPPEETHVWGWGGGVALAELALARLMGCRTAMIASRDSRLALIARLGIQPIDRRAFAELDYDPRRYETDRAYRKRYVQAQKAFAEQVREHTGGAKVSIFIENIGTPVLPATLRALAHRGVIATCGWKLGMDVTLARANECLGHHIHVHTHGCPMPEGPPAFEFAEEHGWVPPVDDRVYAWDEIPQLARDYASGALDTYFPIFQVNPL
jgi:NADPH:quinone reductase-like Zn-dependent oxidoreductase